MRVDGSNLPPLSSFVGKCANNLPSSSARVRGGSNGELYERWRNKVDASGPGMRTPWRVRTQSGEDAMPGANPGPLKPARGQSRQPTRYPDNTGYIYGCSSMESAGLQNRRLGEQSLPPVPDVWFHSSTKRKRAFPVRCAEAAGRRILNWLTPASIKQTVPTDDTRGGVEMYRDYQGRSCDQSM